MAEEYQEIYILDDPRTSLVRYVGISGNALRRYKQHIAASHSLQLQAWNASLEKYQLTPGVTVIDEAATRGEGLEKEAFWIHWFLRRGAPLLNEQRGNIDRFQTLKVLGKLVPRHREADQMFAKLVEAITTGHFQDISFKELAGLEFMMFNMCHAAYGGPLLHDDTWQMMEAEGQKRFNIPTLAELLKHP